MSIDWSADLANIWTENVAGVTHRHGWRNPQRHIPKLEAGDNVRLVADPNNEHDNKAIKVITARGVQIGWYPRKGFDRDKLFRRLTEGYQVDPEIDSTGQRREGTWWCRIKIAVYATPFDLSIEEKDKLRQAKELIAKRKEAMEWSKQKKPLPEGPEKRYFEIVSEVVSKYDWAKDYLGYSWTNEAFGIHLMYNHDFFVVKKLRNRPYLLVNQLLPNLPADIVAKYEVKPSPKSEGNYSSRIFLSDPESLWGLQELIMSSFDGILKWARSDIYNIFFDKTE